MAKLSLTKGTTSKIVHVFIPDSSSTTGAGLTGLVFNSASLAAYYIRPGDTAAAAITLATATLGTWATGGFKEVSSANMPGVYELSIPDACLASGANQCVIMLKGAANMAPVVLEIELTAVNNQSASAFITGVNSLAPPTNWNLASIDGSGRVDVAKIAGTSQTARDIGASVLLSSGTGTGQLDFTAGVVKGNVTQLLGTAWLTPAVAGTPDVNVKSFTASAITSGAFASGAVHATALATGAIRADVFAADSVNAAALAADAVAEIADGVWDEATSGHLTAGTTGAAIVAAGSAGDPWSTSLPGAYGAGTAGKIIGDNINATISSRSTYAGGDTSGTTTLLSRLTSTRAGLLDNLDAAVGDIPTALQNADALLNRDMSAVTVTNTRSPINAFRALRNKWTIAGGTYTVMGEDDSTTAWTSSVSTDAAALPLIGSDPA